MTALKELSVRAEQTSPDLPTLLLVDDEPHILASLRMVFRRLYRVLSTTDPYEALRIVRRERVDVIVSDQRMPGMLGAELLRRVKRGSPGTMRILLTGYSDLTSIMSSINEGEVFRFVSKPWSNDEMREIVASAVRIARNTINAAPVAEEETEETAQLDAPLDAQAATRRLADASLLVIDDEGDLIEACRSNLADPARCLHATDAESALDLLERGGIDILVSDIQVGGQDISDFIKLMKVRYPAIPTIVTSRWLDSGVAIDLINEGQVYRYLKRPVPAGMMRLSLLSAARHASTVQATPALQERYAVAEIREVRNQGLFGRLAGRLWPFGRRK